MRERILAEAREAALAGTAPAQMLCVEVLRQRLSAPRTLHVPRHNLGAYDTAHGALAEALGCELLTGG